MKRNDASPEAYRADVSGWQRDVVERFRAMIDDVLPGIDEGIKYGMLNYPGVEALAAQKHHVSLYVSPAVLDRHRGEMAGFAYGKSCLRFRNKGDLDEGMLKTLLDDIAAHS